MPWQFMIVVCFFNAVLCFLGVFSKNYPDNFFQRIGLALICITSLARVNSLWHTEHDMNLLRSWIHMGILFFAFGTWYKVAIHKWVLSRPRWIPRRKDNEEHTSS